MVSAYWEQVVAAGRRVPSDRSLDELTADLTRMLGDPDPEVRTGVAVPTLTAWIRQGVYDDLLTGLGDGMCAGLEVGLGEASEPSVLRRGGSALLLGRCIDRDTEAVLLSRETVLGWGDRLTGWLVREQDLRGFLPGAGPARAVAHGAEAMAALMRSPRLDRLELVVLLDVIADRVLGITDHVFTGGEEDRLGAACLAGLRRDVLPLHLLEPWMARVAAAAVAEEPDRAPSAVSRNAQAFLRSLHLQLALASPPPTVRTDLLLVLIDHLRSTNPSFAARG